MYDVSIPLESGHIVILFWMQSKKLKGFNPLRIGSYCNKNFFGAIIAPSGFNPLRIGSYCNGP